MFSGFFPFFPPFLCFLFSPLSLLFICFHLFVVPFFFPLIFFVPFFIFPFLFFLFCGLFFFSIFTFSTYCIFSMFHFLIALFVHFVSINFSTLLCSSFFLKQTLFLQTVSTFFRVFLCLSLFSFCSVRVAHVTEVHWALGLHRPPTASPVELGTGALWVSTGTHPCGSPSRQDDGETRAPALRTLDDMLRLSRRCGL